MSGEVSELLQLFVQAVCLVSEMRLVKLGKIAVDGTKVKVKADTGCKSETVDEVLFGSSGNLVVALRREHKQALRSDPHRLPHTVAMTAKLWTNDGVMVYRRRQWIVRTAQ